MRRGALVFVQQSRGYTTHLEEEYCGILEPQEITRREKGQEPLRIDVLDAYSHELSRCIDRFVDILP